jgi:hypothetical protein
LLSCTRHSHSVCPPVNLDMEKLIVSLCQWMLLINEKLVIANAVKE